MALKGLMFHYKFVLFKYRRLFAQKKNRKMAKNGCIEGRALGSVCCAECIHKGCKGCVERVNMLNIKI